MQRQAEGFSRGGYEMSPEEITRLATVEQEMRDVRNDVREMKESLKSLEKIAARGNGALHSALWLGGILGWFVALGITVYNAFKH